MKILQYSIIVISFTFLCSIYLTENFQAFGDGWMPIQNKNTTMRISIQSSPTSLDLQSPQDRQMHLKFFDANTNNPISNVTFGMEITKANQTLLSNAFWTQSGSFTLNLKPWNRNLWSASPDHDPMDGLYYSKGDQIDIDTPYLTGDLYHFKFQPLMYVVGDNVRFPPVLYPGQQNNGIKFETTLNLLDEYNKTMTPTSGEEPEWKLSDPIAITSSSNPVQPQRNFIVQYRTLNGTEIFQAHDYAFTANIHSKTNGIFEIKIPRNFPYYNGKDGPGISEKWLVIENGVNLTSSEYAKTISDCFFTYSVPFYTNSTITVLSMDTLLLMTPIYGDKVPNYCMSETVIPEFPFGSAVLVLSIVSIIVIYRLKFGTN